MCSGGREKPCVDKLCHITTPNAVCLSKQKLWAEAREPRRGNLRPAHVFLHVRDSSLWKGLLTGENKSLSFCGSLFNIQEGVPMGLLGDQGPICSLPSNCDLETHTTLIIRNSHTAVPPALQPLLQGWEGAWQTVRGHVE